MLFEVLWFGIAMCFIDETLLLCSKIISGVIYEPLAYCALPSRRHAAFINYILHIYTIYTYYLYDFSSRMRNFFTHDCPGAQRATRYTVQVKFIVSLNTESLLVVVFIHVLLLYESIAETQIRAA